MKKIRKFFERERSLTAATPIVLTAFLLGTRKFVGSRQRWRAGTAFLLWSAPVTAFLLWSCDGIENGDPDADADVTDDGVGDDNGTETCPEIQVSSSPSGATVTLNGNPTDCTTPCTLTDVPLGDHTFLLILADYDDGPYEETITAECAPLNFTLYPSVGGEWDLTFHSDTTGMEEYYDLHFEQTGSFLTGWDDQTEYTGSIFDTGEMSLFREGSITRTMIGSKISANRLEGTWNSSAGGAGTWWATR